MNWAYHRRILIGPLINPEYGRGREEDRLPPQIPTKKETRYAMIKGWVERKYPNRRPDSHQPLSDAAIEGIYQKVRGK